MVALLPCLSFPSCAAAFAPFGECHAILARDVGLSSVFWGGTPFGWFQREANQLANVSICVFVDWKVGNLTSGLLRLTPSSCPQTVRQGRLQVQLSARAVLRLLQREARGKPAFLHVYLF